MSIIFLLRDVTGYTEQNAPISTKYCMSVVLSSVIAQ